MIKEERGGPVQPPESWQRIAAGDDVPPVLAMIAMDFPQP
ncbi:hypothetical protein X566_09445 [Afipia sp. P52-10]|nr:hypothetical protein X566_09445 [Afipia sp. P52-10]